MLVTVHSVGREGCGGGRDSVNLWKEFLCPENSSSLLLLLLLLLLLFSQQNNNTDSTKIIS